MRWFAYTAVHVVVFGIVYSLVRHLGVHGEVPYIAAAVVTAGVAHITYRTHRRRRWRRR